MLAVAAVSFALLQTLVIPVLSTIRVGMDASGSSVAWLVTAYLLSASIATPLMGRFGDMMGRRRALVITLSLLASGSLLAAVAPTMGVMIAARAVQGLGGGVLPLGFGIIRDEFPDVSVPGAVGSLSALTAGGAGVGLVLAGPLVSLLSFRALFWLPGIAVIMAALAAHLLVPESPARARERISWLPVCLLTTWLLALLLGVSKAGTAGWDSPVVLTLLAVSAVAVVLWVLAELRSEAPLIDMKMMRSRAIWTANVIALAMGAGLYATYAFVPMFLQSPESTGYGFGASVTVSGFMMLPLSIASFIVGTASGTILRHVGHRTLLIVALAVNACSFTLLAIVNEQAWMVVVELTMLGATFGFLLAALAGIVVAGVPETQTGVATGMNANIRTIGGAVGTAVAATVILGPGVAGGMPTEAGFDKAFLLLGAVTLLGVGAAVALPRTTSRQVPSMPHAELGMVAGGTLSGADPE